MQPLNAAAELASWLFHCTMNIDKDKVVIAMKTAATKLGYKELRPQQELAV